MGVGMDDARRKRKAVAKGQTACSPCQLRKVRCSYQSPCQTCVDREHPELCIYGAPAKRVMLQQQLPDSPQPERRTSSPTTVSTWTPSKEQWHGLVSRLERLEMLLTAITNQPPTSPSSINPNLTTSPPMENESKATASSKAMYAKHPMTGENVFLGGNSVPAMAAALAHSNESSNIQNVISQSMLPIFALENNSTMYPFVNIWDSSCGTSERAQQLCALIPANPEALRFLRQYRDNAHVLFPAIIHMEQFEAQVTQFLTARASQTDIMQPNNSTTLVYGKSLNWLGLFFACMASGCQCSNMESKQRQLTSQVFVCCAYECLRLINYLSNSTLEDIQSLLILGNVISNNMNAGVAWTLLGVTIRIAQGLGLHQRSLTSVSAYDTDLRYQIWSRIIWQDSLLSITYDRASSTSSISQWQLSGPLEVSELTYANSMLKLCKIALDIVMCRATTTARQQLMSQVEVRRQEVLAIESNMQPHLRHTSACVCMSHLLEHWNWRMHRSYVLSELLRPALVKDEDDPRADIRYYSLCVEALTETLDAFLNLQSLTAFARTSWAAVHRALSAALLLAILKVPQSNALVHEMINRLISVLTDRENTHASEVSEPVARAVSALSLLNADSKMPMFALDSSNATESSPYAEMENILWGASAKV